MQTNILIADDDVELCELLREFFESEEFTVQLAHDGLAALEAARRPGLDLVVLDVMMPAMNGLDVLKELRKESRLPVIMLTARGDDLVAAGLPHRCGLRLLLVPAPSRQGQGERIERIESTD